MAAAVRPGGGYGGSDLDTLDAVTWGTDWLWSLPLILLNVVIHVFGLAFIYNVVVLILRETSVRLRGEGWCYRIADVDPGVDQRLHRISFGLGRQKEAS